MDSGRDNSHITPQFSGRGSDFTTDESGPDNDDSGTWNEFSAKGNRVVESSHRVTTT